MHGSNHHNDWCSFLPLEVFFIQSTGSNNHADCWTKHALHYVVILLEKSFARWMLMRGMVWSVSWRVGIGRDFSCCVDEFYSLSVCTKCVVCCMLGRIGIGRGLFMMIDVTWSLPSSRAVDANVCFCWTTMLRTMCSLVIEYYFVFVTGRCNPAQKYFIHDWLEGSVWNDPAAWGWYDDIKVSQEYDVMRM